MKIIGDTASPNFLRSTGRLDCTYHYYLSGNSVVEEQNGSAQSIKDHVWGLTYIDEAIQTRINTNPTGTASWSSYWLMQDADYNMLGVVDSSGVLTERYEYTPYGQRQVFTSAGTNDPGCHAPLPISQRVATHRVADIPPSGTKRKSRLSKGSTHAKDKLDHSVDLPTYVCHSHVSRLGDAQPNAWKVHAE